MEGDSEDSAGFAITRSADPAITSGSATDTRYAIAVDFVLGGDAVRGTDYVVMSGESVITSNTISIPEDETAVGLSIKPINDAVKEADMSVTLTITDASSSGVEDSGGCGCCSASWGPGGDFPIDENADTGTVTILDDDWWKVGITADGDVAEPDNSVTAAYAGKCTLTRTKDRTVDYEMDTSYALQVKVQIPVADPTADPQTLATYGSDYTLDADSLWENEGNQFVIFAIAAQHTTRDIAMEVINDAKPEENEQVSLTVVGSAGTPEFAVDGEATFVAVVIEDNDWWSVKFIAWDPNVTERLPEVEQDYGGYQAKRFDANTEDDHKATDKTYPISYTFWTTGTATRTTDFSLSAIAATGEGGAYELIGGPTYAGTVLQGVVSYDTWSSSIPVGQTEAYIRVEPVFDWLDEGEPGNRAVASSPEEEAAYGEYIDGSLATASWSGKPSTYDAVVPTEEEEKRVVIHDGGIIRARTDSDNNGDLDADDDEEENDANSLGRVIMANTDQDLTENDRAETSVYAWVDSLTPEDASQPIEIDVYLIGDSPLLPWDAETGGTELPYGDDSNPADGRIDVETRLVTLTEATTSYEETIYVEATVYEDIRLSLALGADVSNGNPSGWDNTYYTTLKIDALAMAFNYDVGDNSGADGVNLRTDENDDNEHSAPEWYTGTLPLPSSLPNDGLVNQRTVLYLADQAVTVCSRITVDPKYAGMIVKLTASTDGTAILGLQEVELIVSEDGTLLPAYYCVLTYVVNGVDDFVKFEAQNNTSSVVLREDVQFYWEVTYIGADLVNGNETGSNEAVVTDSIRMYTVLDTPQSPWDVSDNLTADDKHQPWVKALEFVTNTAGVNAKDDVAAMATLTTYLHGGHGLVYDTRYGARAYAGSHLGDSMKLSQYIDKTLNNTVNCYDQAAALTSFGCLLGLDVEYKFMQPFGYINTVDLVGVGNCNNPFFTLNSFPQIAGADETGRSLFGNHAFVLLTSKIVKFLTKLSGSGGVKLLERSVLCLE